MKPGIQRIVDEIYHGLDCISNSGWGEFNISPAQYRESRINPEPPTDAMIFGTRFHRFILEPDEFWKRYLIEIKVDKRTTAGKAELAAFKASAIDKEIIPFSDFSDMEKMKAALLRSPEARRFLWEEDGLNEMACIWDDPEYGFRCRLKADRILPRIRTIVDLKTTKDASERAFIRSCLEFGYDRQAAWYPAGVNQAQKEVEYKHFVFVVADRTGKVLVKEAPENMRATGARKIKALLPEYAECKRTGSWGLKIKELNWPEWAR